MTPLALPGGIAGQRLQCLNNDGNGGCGTSILAADGNSITALSGGTAPPPISNRWPDQMLNTLGLYTSYNSVSGYTPQVQYLNIAYSGTTCQQRIDSVDQSGSPTLPRVDSLLHSGQKFSVVTLECGQNDFKRLATTDPNIVYALILTYVADRKAAGWGRVIVATILDDLDARTLYPWSSQYNTFRAGLNTLILNGAVANGYTAIDPGGDANLGCNTCASNPTYFYDGVHPTIVGLAIYAGYGVSALSAIGFN